MHTHIVRIHFDRNNHSFIHSEFFCSILNDNFITGDADDSLSFPHNETKFSTNDQDNDKWSSGSCANKYNGGWWFNDCHPT